MVVDDNADHRDLMHDILEPLGFAVIAAADGAAMPGLGGGSEAGPLSPRHLHARHGRLAIGAGAARRWVTAPPKVLILSANIGETKPAAG